VATAAVAFFYVFRIPISSRLLRARKNVTGSSAFSAIRVKQGSSSYGVWQSMEKSLVIFQPGKVWKEVFYGLLEWNKAMIFQTGPFHKHSHNILFYIDNFTSIVLTTVMSDFHLGRSFGKVEVWKRSGNFYSKGTPFTGSLVVSFGPISSRLAAVVVVVRSNGTDQ